MARAETSRGARAARKVARAVAAARKVAAMAAVGVAAEAVGPSVRRKASASVSMPKANRCRPTLVQALRKRH